MKIKADVMHHTHWDNEWYFTEEDSFIQLNYHFKEMLEAFDKEEINHFLLDGQTAILEDYLKLHSEDKEQIEKLISDKQLFVGPFLAQLDCFISSGEAVVNNLRLGMEYANLHGGSSKVAYLPDSFGQSQDFPKIFNGFGIKDFIFRRGLGDEFDLALDFRWKSNDGSEVIVNTQNAGYGFATDPFINGTLIGNSGLDYDGKDIYSQMMKLVKESSLDNEFLLPIGNDQTPVINGFNEMMKYYNENSEEFEFNEVTIEQYMQKVRANYENLQTYEGEFLNPQYHRIHKSLYSARADIKLLQDKIERILVFEVQPLMSVLSKVGLKYDHKLVDSIWNLLIRSQTHSSATNTDTTNELILKRTEKSYNLALSLKVYLIRKIAISGNKDPKIAIFNTLPMKRDISTEINVYSAKESFELFIEGKKLNFEIIKSEKNYSSTIRKDTSLMDAEKYFYKTKVSISLSDMPGLSYKFIDVVKTEEINSSNIAAKNMIENDKYTIEFKEGKLNVTNKLTSEVYSNVIYFEESGDEGDNYDYSYPTEDMINIFDLSNAEILECYNTNATSKLVLTGNFVIPFDLKDRANKISNTESKYKLVVKLVKNSDVIMFKGSILNSAENHRVRVVVKSNIESSKSIVGTQFGYTSRDVYSPLMDIWKEDGWLEEPSAIEPLLNHVSLKNSDSTVTIFTRGIKEYEIIGDNYTDIALTIFRSVGHLGLPDLNRRPGRASGLAEKIIKTPLSQMKKENHFEFGLNYYEAYDCNIIMNDYNVYATDISYYQNQKFDRVVFPISYFHTNPLKEEINSSENLIDVNSKAVFSSISQDINGNDVVRLCNFENQTIDGGKILINYPYKKLMLCDMLNNELEEISNELIDFRKGEIRNIKIVRSDVE